MKFRQAIYGLAISAISSCCHNSDFTLKQTDPLVKIMHTDSVFVDSPDTVLVARGENATFQFVLQSTVNEESMSLHVEPLGRAKSAGFGDISTGWVHDIKSTNSTSGADDMITADDFLYPDPILDDVSESICAEGHREIIVDIEIPRSIKPGEYTFKLTVNAKEHSCTKKFNIKVYPVTLPEQQSLTVVNWVSKEGLKALNGGNPVPYGSDLYFDLLKIVAQMGARNGQNCWLMPGNPVPVLNDTKDGFTLDFTVYDKTLDILEKYGNMKYFCNAHFGLRRQGAAWKDEMVFRIVTVKNGELINKLTEYKDPDLKTFIESYYSQLEAHLRAKGLIERCYQHIADEPDITGTPSQISYSAVAGMVKAAAPGLRIIDACFEILENQDVSVVILGDNIATMPPVPEGRERWMYTCCGPQGNFANRFLQLPLLKTRLLHWINYKYGECGYLHWGFNYWNLVKDPMVDATPETNWPGGDCYIIYPGDHKAYPCIRLKAMRDGIRDYDLLMMVGAEDRAKAMEFCDRLILGPDKYDMNTDHFRSIRREILEYLSR